MLVRHLFYWFEYLLNIAVQRRHTAFLLSYLAYSRRTSSVEWFATGVIAIVVF